MVFLDRTKRLEVHLRKLEDCDTLVEKKIVFNSMAEMIVTRAGELADKVLIYYNDQKITYAQVNDRSNQVANYLKEQGIKKGDIVSTMIKNSPECLYTLFGAQKLGAIAGPINYMLTPSEIAYVLDDCQPQLIFVDSDCMDVFTQGYNAARHKPVVVEVVTGRRHEQKIAATSLEGILDSFPADEAMVPQTGNDPFLLLYTAGTTGKPKGVLLPNSGQFSVCKARSASNVYQPDEIFMLQGPMFKADPLCVWAYPSIYMGHSMVIVKDFTLTDFWPTITKYGITSFWATPSLLSYAMYQVDHNTIDWDQVKLRHGYIADGSVPLQLIYDYKAKLGLVLADGYGLTECYGYCSTTIGLPFKYGTKGGHMYESVLRIVDEFGHTVPYGEVGEIVYAGYAIMIGYLNQGPIDDEFLDGEFLHTGDMGYLDEQEYLHFVGRREDLVKRGGEYIYPYEIEIPLKAHPKIAQAVVVGKPDPVMGEKVKACIILKAGETMTTQEVKDYLQGLLIHYKIPEFVEFYDSFPLDLSGRVIRSQLK